MCSIICLPAARRNAQVLEEVVPSPFTALSCGHVFALAVDFVACSSHQAVLRDGCNQRRYAEAGACQSILVAASRDRLPLSRFEVRGRKSYQGERQVGFREGVE